MISLRVISKNNKSLCLKRGRWHCWASSGLCPGASTQECTQGAHEHEKLPLQPNCTVVLTKKPLRPTACTFFPGSGKEGSIILLLTVASTFVYLSWSFYYNIPKFYPCYYKSQTYIVQVTSYTELLSCAYCVFVYLLPQCLCHLLLFKVFFFLYLKN